MDEKYFPEQIEAKWQQRWAEAGTCESRDDDPRPRFYALEMLPYPSGFLHMGHVRNYAIGDALAWYKRLRGFNVLHPIGWDSFGQPAEQAAIKRGIQPREWTEENIAHMRGQMQRLGVSYDWRREIAAHRPDYYKWDQWFFLKMLERGLAYKRTSAVNWCPKEETVIREQDESEDEEKFGINPGQLAINPFSGELLPIWVANYVLIDYGAGAVMREPAHDERDFEFARKYTLPIRQVIARIIHGQQGESADVVPGTHQSIDMKDAFTAYGMLVNSAEWSGKLSHDAMREMADYAEAKKFGGGAVT